MYGYLLSTTWRIALGQHKTPSSIDTIDAIDAIGRSLGFHVVREWSIPNTQPHPEQIDLALFIDEKATLPIFAVEIDSADVPASMNNAMKIFGKSTREWVKPLFVFHIFLDVSQVNRRRTNAEQLLNTQNYQTYDFQHDKEAFLKDLLERTLSIKPEVDVVDFALALDHHTWNAVDRASVLDYTARPNFPTLAEIAAITLYTKGLKGALARLVISDRLEDTLGGELSFAGQMFNWPLMLGLRAHHDPTKARDAFEMLRVWQQDPMCIIFNPEQLMLGLSSDFDRTILELEPPVFCLMSMLFHREPEAAKAFGHQLFSRSVSNSLDSNWARYSLLWCAVTSARANDDELAERAINRINTLGGLPSSVLTAIPGTITPEDDATHWEAFIDSQPASPVALPLLKEEIVSLQSSGYSPDELVSEILLDDNLVFELNHRVLGLQVL